MKKVKRVTSDSYQDSLIERLKNPTYAVAYIEAILEVEDPEFELLAAAIKDVIDARIKMNNLSEEAKLSWEKLDKILSPSGGAEIYGLVKVLDALGFSLKITEKPTDS